MGENWRKTEKKLNPGIENIEEVIITIFKSDRNMKYDGQNKNMTRYIKIRDCRQKSASQKFGKSLVCYSPQLILLQKKRMKCLL